MIVGIVTDQAVGGTFLTWTLHFLSGHTEYYCTNSSQWTGIPPNPVTKHNAHSFKPNQPTTYSLFLSTLDKLLIEPTNTFHTIYFHRFRTSDNEIELAVDKTFDIAKKRIVLSNNASTRLYNCKYGERSLHIPKFSNSDELYNDYHEYYTDFIDTFFKESKQEWGDPFKNKWEEREFLALNLRPYNYTPIVANHNLVNEHYWLDTTDLWNSFDVTVKDLFKYLEQDIDMSRWDRWINVYNQWKRLHYDRQQFAIYFDHIVDSIINNSSLDLTRFNFDIVREAAIQHVLIYKHGLTIKSWGLEKFPANAKDLHALLETNIYHKVDDIYNMLEKGTK